MRYDAAARPASGLPMTGSDASGVFEGYASLFGISDGAGDVMAPGAFSASIAARGAAGIRMLFQHDPGQSVGTWLDIREDGRGLIVRGQLSRDVQRSRELFALLGQGGIDGLSIGFRTQSARRDRAAGQRHIFKVDLWEISLVTFPMLTGARVYALKSTAPPVASPRIVPPDSARTLHAASQPRAPAGLAARLRRGAKSLSVRS